MPSWLFANTDNVDRTLLLGALFGAFLSLYFLFKPADFSTVSLQFVGEIQSDGVIQRRPSRSLSWQKMNGGGSVYLRDYVYVPKDTKAKVVFENNTFLDLEPDSLIQFDEILQDQIQISLEMKTKKNDFLSWLPSLQQKLTHRLKSLSPLEELKASLEQTRLASFEHLASLRKISTKRSEEIPTQFLEDFELALIHPEEERYNLLSNRWLEVEWTTIPFNDVVYKIEVSQTSDFRKKIKYETKKSHLKIQLTDAGDYYWKVTATQKEQQISSKVGHFNMTSRGGKTLLKYKLPKVLYRENR